jgi:hypothetical protein
MHATITFSIVNAGSRLIATQARLAQKTQAVKSGATVFAGIPAGTVTLESAFCSKIAERG